MISCAGVTGSVGITCHDQLCWGVRECGSVGTWVLHIMISCAGVMGSVGITCHDQLCWGDRECGYYTS